MRKIPQKQAVCCGVRTWGKAHRIGSVCSARSSCSPTAVSLPARRCQQSQRPFPSFRLTGLPARTTGANRPVMADSKPAADRGELRFVAVPSGAGGWRHDPRASNLEPNRYRVRSRCSSQKTEGSCREGLSARHDRRGCVSKAYAGQLISSRLRRALGLMPFHWLAPVGAPLKGDAMGEGRPIWPGTLCAAAVVAIGGLLSACSHDPIEPAPVYMMGADRATDRYAPLLPAP